MILDDLIIYEIIHWSPSTCLELEPVRSTATIMPWLGLMYKASGKLANI